MDGSRIHAVHFDENNTSQPEDGTSTKMNHLSVTFLEPKSEASGVKPLAETVVSETQKGETRQSQTKRTGNYRDGRRRYSGVPRMEGHLYKWTNYLKGWQRRLFVLENGVLSYYAERGAPLAPGEEEVPPSPIPFLRSPRISVKFSKEESQAGQTVCRGRINLQLAVISHHDSDPARLAIDTGTQIYHLRADSNELCKQWVDALVASKKYFERLMKRAASRRMRAMVERASQEQGKVDATSKAEANKEKVSDDGSSDDENKLDMEFGEEDAATLQALQSRDEIIAELVRVQTHLRESLTKEGDIDVSKTLFDALSTSMSSSASKIDSSVTILASLVDLLTWSIHVLNSDEALWKHRLIAERGRAMRAEAEATSLQRQLDELLRDIEESGALVKLGNTNWSAAEDEDEFYDAGGSSSPRVHSETHRDLGTDGIPVVLHSNASLSQRRFAVRAILQAAAKSASGTPSLEGAVSRKASSTSSAVSTLTGEITRAHSELKSLSGVASEPRKRLPISDSETPPKPSLWSILKDAVGKDLSKISIPVVFNEPISFLQRLVEDVEASYLLDRAATTDDPVRRLLYVAALAVSHYSSTIGRTGKPFNPLLGETFEYIAPDGESLHVLCEQVSHHPPVSATHASGRQGLWTYSTTCEVRNKFWGKSVEVFPKGICHVRLGKYGDHITYEKATTCVHNILVGKVWIDNYGDIELVNHTNGYRCMVKLTKTGSFFGSQDSYGSVRARVLDPSGRECGLYLEGAWHSSLRLVQTATGKTSGGRSLSETIWTRPLDPPDGASGPFHMTQFAIALNELTEESRRFIAPTDSRLRPDQRLLENAEYSKATSEKVRLEEKQRAGRRAREKTGEGWKPRWFTLSSTSTSDAIQWEFNGAYWKARDHHEWKQCPDIF